MDSSLVPHLQRPLTLRCPNLVGASTAELTSWVQMFLLISWCPLLACLACAVRLAVGWEIHSCCGLTFLCVGQLEAADCALRWDCSESS